MPNMNHILIVDDDARIRTMLRRYLEGEGFRISEAADCEAARNILADDPPKLVLLDLMLNGEDGLEIARAIQGRPDIGIIIVTGKGDTIDRVLGLEMGADDYVTKPFHLRELLARARSILRRLGPPVSAAAPAGSPAAPNDHPALLGFEGFRLNLERRALATQDGEDVPLTTGEFNLLKAFIEHPNRVLNRDQLLDFTQNRDWSPFDRSIDTQVGRLRRKIEPDPERPTVIKTVRGVGYIFTSKIEKIG